MMAEDFVQKNYRHNFAANLLEGAVFTLGLAFFSSATILPLYVRHLVDAPWLISLVPAITQAGWFLPQLLTSQQVGLRRRRLPYVLALSANERFPVLVLGLSVLLWPNLPTAAALAIFLILFTWQTVGGGITAPGWVDLVARMIPVNRRGRLFGFTALLGNLWGALGAVLAGFFLRKYGYPTGYGYVFIGAAVCFLLSWFFLSRVRDPIVETVNEPQPRRDYWRGLLRLLRDEPNLQRFLWARVPGIFGLAANGFLAVYAVKHFGLSDEAAGGYTAALVLSVALSNPILGLLGDRVGHKAVLEASLVVEALSLALALLAPHPGWFYLVFALQGIQNGAFQIAAVSIVMEFGRPEDRPGVVALANTVQGFFFLIAPPLAGLLASGYGYRVTFWTALGVVVVAIALLHLVVREPRHQLLEGSQGLPAGDTLTAADGPWNQASK